jgi:uncharacterized protein YecE (DUF72 family)
VRVRIGTSGFGYSEWAGKFFPKGLKPALRLRYYSERFDATEINNTFYRLPKASVLEGWAQETPKVFSFSFKAPGKITHMRRLKGCAADVELFLSLLPAVGRKLGVADFQLPPNFKLDLQRLKAFVLLLPRGGRYAFEFRHPSWFVPEVYAVLEKRGIALALNDADVEGCPLVPTAKFGYLKLRRVEYTDAELRAWAKKIARQPWKEAHVFFKHEERATGPKLAARLREIVG